MGFYGQRLRHYRTGYTFAPTEPAPPVAHAALMPSSAVTPTVFARKLKQLAEASLRRELPSVRELTALIKRIETGKFIPDVNLMQSFQAAFGISLERQIYWLHESVRVSQSRSSASNELVLRPKSGLWQLPLHLLDGHCASTSYAAIASGSFERRDGMLKLPAALAEKASMAIVGSGCDAVMPGTVILARQVPTRRLQSGALVLAAIHNGKRGEYVIRRVRRLPNGQLALYNDGTNSPPSLVQAWPAAPVCIAAEILLILPDARALGCEWGHPPRPIGNARKDAA